MLLEEGFLLSDVTLPHGVFKPYASVKTHILIIDRKLARKSDSVLFVEIENDGFTQSDTRDPVEGSQLGPAQKCLLSFKIAVESGRKWKPKDYGVRAYAISKHALTSTKDVHLLGRWHDLPNRVIHRKDIPLIRLGDLCEIHDGLSPNMATPPGDFALVVPAGERKTADHWDFEGRAVCIPLISSAGHGKAEIKRIHYEEGRFALATTMCALFVKDEKVVRPRYLHIFLNVMSRELLVPLMSGATNIRMSSSQLMDVLIPVPEIKLQDEVIESYLIDLQAAHIIEAATKLCNSSADKKVIQFSERVIGEAKELLAVASKRTNISHFLPS
jgi:type I restriction enzyme M protein